MRTLIATCLALFISGTGIAQNGCSKYYPFKEGTSFQITTYDKKGKSTAVIDYTVKESNGNSATLGYEMSDSKGETVMASEYELFCENDGISIDFKSLMAPGMLEQYKDMEVDISGTNLELPNNLSPGQTLPDAEVLMNISMTPMTMKLTTRIFNRNVGPNETITTPAGTFDCTVITSEHESKMGVKMSGSDKQWLAGGVGMVKQESYNKKGNLVGSSVLTKFED
ncbi:MAG TPA: hypothetical protein VKN36_19200 [Eudoraea sp.]|nr:hypothetical protein [Eudoraea sp.]